MKKNPSKKYSELKSLNTFDDRFKYLKLNGSVGSDTFGFDRYINQDLYKSREWKSVRNEVIARDDGCDLGIPGRDIHGKIYVHHMNPITVNDIMENPEDVFNPDFLVCVSMDTHNAIHYGDIKYLEKNKLVKRAANDTSPWKEKNR